MAVRREMNISAKGLRTRIGEVLDCVERGEQVTVTYRGKPRARLVPIDAGEAESSDSGHDPTFGMWRDHDEKADVASYVRRLRGSPPRPSCEGVPS